MLSHGICTARGCVHQLSYITKHSKKPPKTLPIKSWIEARNVGLKMKEENKLQQIVGEQQTRLKMLISPNRKHDWIVSKLAAAFLSPLLPVCVPPESREGGGHKWDNQPWKLLFNSQLDLHLICDYLVQTSDLLVLENHCKLCHVSSQQHDLKQAAQDNREFLGGKCQNLAIDTIREESADWSVTKTCIKTDSAQFHQVYWRAYTLCIGYSWAEYKSRTGLVLTGFQSKSTFCHFH